MLDPKLERSLNNQNYCKLKCFYEKITIYATRFCGYCNAAIKWLEQKGLEYQEIRLYEGNEMEKFREAYPELRTSPQIFCDGENIGGFTDLVQCDPMDLQ